MGGMSHPENPARGVSLSGVGCTERSRAEQSRHHLASWNATECGVEELRGCPVLQGGWVIARRWRINSSRINRLIPT